MWGWVAEMFERAEHATCAACSTRFDNQTQITPRSADASRGATTMRVRSADY